jgi:hypothetical protein
MSSTCFEPEGSPSGRRLYVQVWYNLFICQRYKQSTYKTAIHTHTHTHSLSLFLSLSLSLFNITVSTTLKPSSRSLSFRFPTKTSHCGRCGWKLCTLLSTWGVNPQCKDVCDSKCCDQKGLRTEKVTMKYVSVVSWNQWCHCILFLFENTTCLGNEVKL